MSRFDRTSIACTSLAENAAGKQSNRRALAQGEPIAERPSLEKPREKLKLYGVKVLSDAELLTLWLGAGLREADAHLVGQEVLASFGSLNSLLEAQRDKFCGIKGIGEVRFSQWQVMVEICRRAAFEVLREGDVMSSPSKVRNYLSLQLAGLQHEVFSALFLDNRHRVLHYEVLFQGTIDGAAVYPREVVKQCLAVNGAAVIFAHNHPSGVAEPSDADIRLTKKLTDALALIDIRVLDHLIIGRGVQTSLAERGLL